MADSGTEKQKLRDRIANLGQRLLASRGLRLERVPRPMLEHPEGVLQMHLDYALAQRVAQTKDFFFVQIGAFDGRLIDPLFGWVQAYRWRGLLVEPQAQYFGELVENYGGVDGLEFRQIAVGTTTGTRTLYTVANEEGVPRWAGMLASFDRETVLSHRRFLPEIDELLRSEAIECVAINDLLAEADADHIDLLQIDVEGYDHELVAALDLDRFAPSIVRFEHVHLTREQHEASIGKLIAHGYRVCLEEHDTLAYRPTDSPLGDLDTAVEGPARLQTQHEHHLAALQEAHLAQVAELERRLAGLEAR
jgi:FkbM family methyltransferase